MDILKGWERGLCGVVCQCVVWARENTMITAVVVGEKYQINVDTRLRRKPKLAVSLQYHKWLRIVKSAQS